MLHPFSHPHTTRRGERGQAIVIIALSMIVLLGFTGLAIDGGGLIALYRDAVNATDASVLAASYAICAGGDPTEVGIDTARKNGFNNDGVTNTVTVNYPPVRGPEAGNPDYVEVNIVADKPAYFVHVLYREPLRVNVSAIGYCRQKFNPATLGGVVGLSDTCDNAIDVSGAGQTIVGGMTSNTDIDFTGGGQPVNVTGDLSAAGQVEINPNKVTLNGTATNGAPKVSNPMSIIDINDYAPGGAIYEALPAHRRHYIVGNFEPARNSVLAGLYFVEGNVTIRPSDNVTWDPNVGATIVSRGAMDIHVDSGVGLAYYTELLSLGYTDLPVAGFLAYTEFGARGCTGNAANNAISFTGKVNSAGVLYAPNGQIDASFPDVQFVGAIIGWRVKLSGAQATIIHDPTLLPPLAPKVQIAQ